MPEALISDLLGEVILLDVVPWEVMRIEVSLAIAERRHELRRGIAQVKGDGEVTRLLDEGQRLVDGVVGGVTLLRGR